MPSIKLGLALTVKIQSAPLHHRQRLRHHLFRLRVFMEAPRSAIDAVLAGHELVLNLVGHGWLHLLRIDSETDVIEQYDHGAWVNAAGSGY